MTAYLVWREVDGGFLNPLGSVDANSPEHAVRRMIHSRLPEQDGELDAMNGVYFSAPEGSTARIEIAVEPSVKINLVSDREVKTRAPRKPQKATRGRRKS